MSVKKKTAHTFLPEKDDTLQKEGVGRKRGKNKKNKFRETVRPEGGADGRCEQRKCELEAVLLHFI